MVIRYDHWVYTKSNKIWEKKVKLCYYSWKEPPDKICISEASSGVGQIQDIRETM